MQNAVVDVVSMITILQDRKIAAHDGNVLFDRLIFLCTELFHMI